MTNRAEQNWPKDEVIEMDAYTYFTVDGREYRTADGYHVQGLDGKTWNNTYSVRVIVAAAKAYKAA